jgi:hypothetical protein
MRVRYAVTFEFDALPPLTHRGTVSGSNAVTVAKRALKAAMAVHRGVKWASLNVVLLERLPDVVEFDVPTAEVNP